MNRAWSMTLIVATALAHAAAPDDYAIVVPLTTAGDSPAWRVELPIEAYAWSQDEALRDVVVFDAEGRSVVATEWTPPATKASGGQRARREPLAVPAPAVASNEDLKLLVERDESGSLRLATRHAIPSATPSRVWLLDVADFTAGIDALHLTWSQPTDGVFARFGVDASDDLQAWRNLRADAVVALLLQSDARIERRTIPLDGQRAHYLRLRRLDDGSTLEGFSVVVERLARSAAQETPMLWTPAASSVTPEPMTAFDYDLPARVPIEALRATLAGDNSASDLVLSNESIGPDGRSAREPVLRFTAYRLRAGGEVLDQGDIAVPRTRRVARLHLESTRLLASAPSVQVGWRPASLVFLAEGRAPYVLAAGRAGAQRESTSLATPLAELRARFGDDWQPPVATTGVVRIAAGEAALRPPPAPGSWRRILLWVVLGGGAVLVAGLAVALLRGQRSGD